jgi:hypothetical protein
MSYLELSKGIPSFTKAVISLWFRVPQESMDAADAAYTGNDGELLEGIVPLVVMGKRGTGNIPLSWRVEQVLFETALGSLPVGRGQVTEIIYGGPCPEHGTYPYIYGSNYLYCSWIPGETYHYYKDVTMVHGGRRATNESDLHWGVGGTCVNFETCQPPSVSGYSSELSIMMGEPQAYPSADYPMTNGQYITTGCTFLWLRHFPTMTS